MSNELSIGEQLRAARENAGVNICELSERGKVDRQRIYNVERGNEQPSEKMLQAYVAVCGLHGLPGNTLFLNANKMPPDLFAILKANPQLCEILKAELTNQG